MIKAIKVKLDENFFIYSIYFFYVTNIQASENKMILKLKDGDVHIQLFSDVAPNHVKRIKRIS